MNRKFYRIAQNFNHKLQSADNSHVPDRLHTYRQKDQESRNVFHVSSPGRHNRQRLEIDSTYSRSRQTSQTGSSERYHLMRLQTDITDRGVRQTPTPGRHHRQAPPTKNSRRLLRHGDSPKSDNATASERLTLSDYSEMMTNELPFTQIGYSVPWTELFIFK